MLAERTRRALCVAVVALGAGGASSAMADLIPIVNPSFEADIIEDRVYNLYAQGWVTQDDAGAFNPVAEAYAGGVAPDGSNVGFVQSGWVRPTGWMEQTVDAVLQADIDYELTTLVGRRLDNPLLPWRGYIMTLWAGSNLLATDDTGVVPQLGEWLQTSVTFRTDANDPRLGQPLKIRFESKFGQTNFDTVALDATPIPGAGSLALLGVGATLMVRRRR